jgi:diguanylate cyclase (GGDEF)-like protein/PAS domain S-box-containing protein
VLISFLSAAAGVYFFSPPHYSWDVDVASLLAAAAFLLASALTGWVVHRLRTASTALHAALERLAVNERKLQAVIDDQTEMLFRFDGKGKLLFVNQAGRHAFALTDDALGRLNWQVLVLPDEHAAVEARLAELAPGNAIVKTETRFLGLEGETRWGEFIHRASFDASGKLQQVQTVGRDVTERRQLQVELAETSASLQDLYDNAPCAYYSLDEQGKFIQLNRKLLGWLGCSMDDALGKLGPKDFFIPEGVRLFNENYPKFMAQGRIGPLEFDLVSRGGTVRRVSMSATAIRDENGAFLRSRSVMYDVTELAQIRMALELANREQGAMLENELIGIVKLKDRRPVWMNRAMGRMFGYAPGELEDHPSRVLYFDDASYEQLGRDAYPVLAQGGTFRTQQRMRHKDGHPIWIDSSGALISPETGESLWMMLDITAMKEHTERVEQVAFHDGLTGLPNRILLTDRLHQAIPLALRTQLRVAVCFIDLDGFKAVNDQLGHAAGDKLLQVVAMRLQECVRGNDTVARLGGDEFVLVLTHLQSRDECEQVLGRVRSAIATPVDVGDGVFAQVAASIGVAFCPEDGTVDSQLLRVADEAMYAAKHAGKASAMAAPLR